MNSPLTPAFVAAVVHDLRGPLGALGTWVHVLGSGRADRDTQAQALAAMARDVRAQGALLEQLSDLAAALAGDVELRLETIAPAPLLETACAADGTVKLDLGSSDATVRADAERLRRLLVALVSTAVKRPAGATLAVRLDASEADVSVTAEGPGAPRLLSVALVRALAELMSGSLDVASTNAASTLVVRLPRR